MNQTSSSERIKSAVAVAGFHALLGYAFIAGLGVDVAERAGETLKLFDVAEPPPPPIEQVIPAERRTEAPEGEAAPPNLKSKATPVVAPKPRVPLEVPPPVTAAPTPAQGSEASSGAAPVPGPGTGAGGVGTGTGSGGQGDGTGGGGLRQRARLLRGELSRADYPRAARRAGIGGRVVVRIDVGTNGRVSACSIVQSSGNADLDETSCRLIRQRYRYEPARDAQGRPAPDSVREGHVWFTDDRRGRYPREEEPRPY
jgi:periplasmic protein TonB